MKTNEWWLRRWRRHWRRLFPLWTWERLPRAATQAAFRCRSLRFNVTAKRLKSSARCSLISDVSDIDMSNILYAPPQCPWKMRSAIVQTAVDCMRPTHNGRKSPAKNVAATQLFYSIFRRLRVTVRNPRPRPTRGRFLMISDENILCDLNLNTYHFYNSPVTKC